MTTARDVSIRRTTRLCALVGIVALAAVSVAGAQTKVTVAGVVRDGTSGQPLIGAIVTLGTGESARTTRTEEKGAFSFANVLIGSYVVDTRRLGYEPARRTVDISPETAPIEIALTRVATLDTVRVRGADQAIFGAVGTSTDLRPLRKAVVQVYGSSTGEVTVDSTGHFFFPVKTSGAYVVRAKVDGYVAQTVSVTVPHNDGVEVALLLDSAVNGPSHMLEAGYADFHSRLLVRRLSSALVPRGELLEHDASEMLTAIRLSRSFATRGLRMGSAACVFVDGNPRPGYSLNAVDPREVEAVELYGLKGDASLTLVRRWPRGAPCGDTGGPSVTPGDDVVQWIVIWLKH